MPRAISGSAQDLKLLKAGLCPDCGAAVTAGMLACASCKVTFGAHASVLQPAAPASAPPSAPPMGARGAHAPAPRAPSSAAQGLTAEQIDDLERGMQARALFPHTLAEGPENGGALALGSALARGAQLVMAEAALVDDVQVLAGGKVPPTAIPRLRHNMASTLAALVDDALPVASVVRAPAPPARAPAAAAPPAPPVPPAPPAPAAPAFRIPPHTPAYAMPPHAPRPPPASAAPPAAVDAFDDDPETMPEQPAFDPDATVKEDLAATIQAARELIARGGPRE